ncbi:MAG: peptidylprolyl isomerase [Flavobacteriales bacterium]|jgi:peptidyl-prolyl cis-trans isomerase SurA|tara:strand:+ start:4702 stop:6069 length:1368 start_codon:yes stop_codon:yes gene_type:complete
MLKNQNNLKSINKLKLTAIAVFLCGSMLSAQVTVDGIAGVVGNNIVLNSDVEQQLLQYQAQGLEVDAALRVQVLEDLLFQKLMLHQAVLDSVVVTENEVFNEIDSRINNFILQLGSEDQLESYFDKKIYEIKEEMFEPIENSLLIQRVRYDITSAVTITPSEIRSYFSTFPIDSLPTVNEEVEVAQILKLPPPSASAISETKKKLEKLKERINKGESFGTLAILYSEDPGSSRNGGLYTSIKRGMFVKEFEAVMFSLEEGEVSEVFKTEYGYHIAVLEERRENEVDIRHILMSPKISPIDLNNAKELLIEVRDSILNGELLFEKAALTHSDDKTTKFNGGKLINSNTGTSKFEIAHLEQGVNFAIENLEIEAISDPIYLKMEDGKEAYRMFILLDRKELHQVNLIDDYKKIRDLALESKKDESIEKWIAKSLEKTYVRVSELYKSEDFQYNWLKK